MSSASESDHLERFRRFVAQQFGLQFDETKLAFLNEVLDRRLEATGRTPATYLTGLERGRRGDDELAALAQALTIGETYFFRNIEQFNAFTEIVLAERMRAQRARRRLRFVSAGCASGEEAYSLAIVLRAAIPDPSWSVTIRAVDVNPASLEKARRARFTTWALRETPLEIQRRAFRQEGRDVVLNEAARRAVTFEERNLALDDPELWHPDAYDAVFCRNLLMYFTPEQAHALVGRITRALAPGGYLFLGHAESLRGLSEQYHLCHTHGTFYYQRRDEIETAAELTAPRSAPAPAAADITADGETWVGAIQAATRRVDAMVSGRASSAATAVAAPPRPDLQLVLDLLRQERFADALEVVHRFPLESGLDPDVLLLHAVLLAHSGQLAAAEEACHRLLGINDLNGGAHYVLALCREGVGDARAAADHDRMAAYLDPVFAMPRLHLGMLARRGGDAETARRDLGQALLLLQREDASRLLLFGGGFGREALIALCRAEIAACGGHP